MELEKDAPSICGWHDVPFICPPYTLVILFLTHFLRAHVGMWAYDQNILYSLCNQVLTLVFVWAFWHVLWVDMEERWVLVVFFFHHLKWGINFYHSPMWPPLMAHGLRKGQYLEIHDWESMSHLPLFHTYHFTLHTMSPYFSLLLYVN